MKKTLITLLALGGLAMGETIDLTPTAAFNGTNTSDAQKSITAADVFAYNLNTWHGLSELSGQSNTTAAGTLSLQIGGAATKGEDGGNYVGLKFDTISATEAPATLTFNAKVTQSWGAKLNSFTAEYTCTVYGFDTEGTATQIGSWTSGNIAGSTASTYTAAPSITLAGDAYDTYGIIFHSMDQSDLGGQSGMKMDFTGITITTATVTPPAPGDGVPEPTTATLSLLALAGLAARRRRR